MTSSAAATIVVELTPPGRGAVAVVVVAGPNALRAVGNCFVARSGRSISDTPLGRIVYGRWGGPEGEEIVLCRRDEDQIEVHCHGGTAAVEAVASRLTQEGCQRLSWQEWINRCAPDRLQAAAQIALADAATERTAAILLDQFNGALSATIREVISSVAAAEWSTAAKTIDEVLSRQELGLRLITPWRIVVFGAPNVGKSSLINALAGYDRAIVSPTPGTTRDVVTVGTAIDGWPVQLSDTAGFRETEDELESAGIELATTALSKADLAIFVHDATKLHDQIDYDSPQLAFHKRAIHVINKIDLISNAERSQLIPQFFNLRPDIDPPQVVSALNGEGIANLISAIARLLLTGSLPAGSPVPFTREQVNTLTATMSAIDNHDAAAASTLLHALLTPSSI